LQSQTARERGVKIWTGRKAVAECLTQAQYVNKAVGVYNSYAKKGIAQYKNQERWRKQARINYVTEQQQVLLSPDLLDPRTRPAEQEDLREVLTQLATNDGSIRFKLPPQSSNSKEDSIKDSDEDEFAAATVVGPQVFRPAGTFPESCERLTITPTKVAATMAPAPVEVVKAVGGPMVGEEEQIVSYLGFDVEACIPRIPFNVDFQKKEPRTNDFNLQGILKSITENPLSFGAVDQLVNLKAQPFNFEKYEKQKLRVESNFFNTLASHEAAKPLADFIEDRNDSPILERRLIVLYQATRVSHKLNLLNWALC